MADGRDTGLDLLVRPQRDFASEKPVVTSRYITKRITHPHRRRNVT